MDLQTEIVAIGLIAYTYQTVGVFHGLLGLVVVGVQLGAFQNRSPSADRVVVEKLQVPFVGGLIGNCGQFLRPTGKFRSAFIGECGRHILGVNRSALHRFQQQLFVCVGHQLQVFCVRSCGK